VLLVGDGPHRSRLQSLVADLSLEEDVVFAGSRPWSELPLYFAAADVFCMPCRTRRGGLEPEGLGIVYLEASATGLPVVAGDSGGAPDAVQEGVTGHVVDGRSPEMIADRVSRLLTDRATAAEMGRAGRRWVEQRWRWDDLASRLARLLGSP
jgi:phosphatidylinositol alpha-1,6-mannosyltransferase